MRKLLIFLVGAIVVFSLLGLWYYQRNAYSKEVMKLELLGPANPKAFDEAEYTVKYKNNGNITLEYVRLTFEYPDYTIVPEGEKLRKTETVDDIYPGQERTVSFKGRLVGAENETREAKVSISYRPKNIKARYESQTSHTAVMAASPLTLELDLPQRIDSGRTFSFWINYFSNTDYPVDGLRVIMDYPAGFGFVQSKPAGLDKNEWQLDLLNKAEGGRIEVQGNLQGDVYEQKNFRITLGLWLDGEFVLLKEATRALSIMRPSLYISQTINGVQGYIANPGDMLHYEIFFRNAGQQVFENMFLVVRLDGRPLDLNSVRTEDGSFKSGDNSIIFDWQNIPQLRYLGSGDEGKVDFWVKLKDEWPILGAGDKNFSVKTVAFISQIKEEFVTKVNGKLKFSQLAYFQNEIFANMGPIPPEVGKETTYTVIWRAQAAYNDLGGVKVKTILPQSVKLTGKIFPEDAHLTFDSESREVVWEVGDIEAQQNPQERSIAFQMAFTPTADQQGTVPRIVGSSQATAIDNWTQNTLQVNTLEIDTSLPDDNAVDMIGGTVIGPGGEI